MKKKLSNPGLTGSVLEIIRRENLVVPGDSVLVAVSGGADSTALLHILAGLAPGLGVNLAVAHLNHQLRGGESDEDQTFVEQLAASLGLPFYSKREDVRAFGKKHRLNLEESARRLRYRFLFDTADCHGATTIATAHHADDNAELFLMNLFRGSGSSGLKTMGPRGHGGRVIRPLVDTTRQDILVYLHENHLSFRHDRSNDDRTFLRNRIRHELLPLIENSYQQGIGRTLNRTARIFGDDEAFLDGITESIFQEAVREQTDQSLTLAVSVLASRHRAIQRRVIRKAMGYVKKDLRRISFVHTEQAVDLLAMDGTLRTLDFPGRLRAVRKDDVLVFRREDGPLRQTPALERTPPVSIEHQIPRPGPEGFHIEIPFAPGRSCHFHFSVVPAESLENLKNSGPFHAFLDLDRLKFPLILRNTRTSDRFQPLGMQGRKKPPSRLCFQQIEISGAIPGFVLVSGDDIAWVCGHRNDERFKRVESTENVLKIELFLD